MFRKFPSAALFLLLPLIGVYGCSSPETESEVPTPSAAETDEQGEHEHEETGEMTDMEKMNETLAKLPPEDRESAMKQHFCPVSGKMLGTMGMPKKIEVEGQTVWICCEGCEDQVRAEPEKYLAKIDE